MLNRGEFRSQRGLHEIQIVPKKLDMCRCKIAANKANFDREPLAQRPTEAVVLAVVYMREAFFPRIHACLESLTLVRAPATRQKGSQRSRSPFCAVRTLTPR